MLLVEKLFIYFYFKWKKGGEWWEGPWQGKGWWRNVSPPSRLGDHIDRSPFRGGRHASSSSLGTAKRQEGAGGKGIDDRRRGDGTWTWLEVFKLYKVRTHRNEREGARTANWVDKSSSQTCSEGSKTWCICFWHFRGFFSSGTLMSDQRWSSYRTVLDGKHYNISIININIDI